MITPNSTYDFIITGFGCAGMSFVYHLLESKLKNSRILVIDSSNKNTNDRTWCYWAEKPLSIHPKNSPIVSWQNISISMGKKTLKKQLGALNYFHIKSSDFYSEIKERISLFPNVHFVLDSVSSITENNATSVSVSTLENGTYLGRKIFNSIPNGPLLPEKNRILRQVFLGWQVKTQNSCFETDTAVLMNFLGNSNGDTDFFYLLPFSPTEALIEYTVFTTEHLDAQKMEFALQRYISQRLGKEPIEISFKEAGSIPMTTYAFSKIKHPNITHLGTLAGCSKPSTGYTFHTIQKHCASIVRALESKPDQASLLFNRKIRFSFYDNIILNIAKKWPHELPRVFFNLFEKNSGPEILRFLNEETSFIHELKLLSRLKFSIFIKSLLRFEKH
ncbi:lycopene cyclase family protein [Cyclobacterium salsum]|uniref:lycopene cyclase family protein n=1 Tax=Cyclobacterium salsum TaxID=2666329 RepID=UPI001391181B|nr:lycopene cyclase family protein [Cyclobacterium salsum]